MFFLTYKILNTEDISPIEHEVFHIKHDIFRPNDYFCIRNQTNEYGKGNNHPVFSQE